MTAYYNEIEPYAAQWLRNLISAGEIAPGEVDERDIRDVRPDELAGFTQCHFFAGIGVWSHALRSAGWDDDREVWTGSCPCQPFSAAGSRKGAADERHLWPHWFHLITERRPSTVFGEQVASKDGLGWFDLVSADLEGSGYAVGSADLCAAGVGAPHIRQRLWFVGDTIGQRLERHPGDGHAEAGREKPSGSIAAPSSSSRMADGTSAERKQRSGKHGQQSENDSVSGLAFPAGERRDIGTGFRSDTTEERGGYEPTDDIGIGHNSQQPSPTNGFWGNADWLFCRDGKWRPVEPGTFPLVDGSCFKMGSSSAFEGKSRQGMLRGYGNAINADVAKQFIQAYRETIERVPA